MITQELVEFIKNQLAVGRGREEISGLLRQNGWVDADISEAFTTLSPSPVVPAQPITPQPIIVQPVVVQPSWSSGTPPTIQPKAEPMPVTAKRKFLPWVIGFVAVVIIAILGYVAHGYYQKNAAATPEKIVGEAFAKTLAAPAMTFTGTIDVALDQPLPLPNLVDPTTTDNVTSEGYRGTITLAGVLNLESQETEIHIKDGTQKFDIEAKFVKDQFYVKPNIEVFGVVNEWVSLDNNIKASSETNNKRDRIVKAFATGSVMLVDEKLNTVSEDGETMLHYRVHFNKELISERATELLSSTTIEKIPETPIEVWISKEKGDLRKIKFETAIEKGLGAGPTGTVSVDLSLKKAEHESIIEVPAQTKTFEEVMKQVTAKMMNITEASLSEGTKSALQDARTKAMTAKVKTILSSMRPQAELFFSETGNMSYGTPGNKCSGSGAGSLFTHEKGLKGLLQTLKETLGGTGEYRCYSTGKLWAVASTLPTGGYFCADSNGYAGTIPAIGIVVYAHCQ